MSYLEDRKAIMSLYAGLQEEYPELATVPLQINARLRSRLGRCRFKHDLSTGRYEGERYVVDLIPQVIEVGRWVIEADPEEALDTVLHEAAHALAGHEAAHGPAWKAWAVRLGANPSRCATNPELAKQAPARQLGPKWRWDCPTCGATDTRQRRPGRHKRHVHCARGEAITWTQLR